MEIRKLILSLKELGHSQEKVAEIAKCDIRTVKKWWDKNSILNSRGGGRPSSFSRPEIRKILKCGKKNRKKGVKKFIKEINDKVKRECSVRTIQWVLAKEGCQWGKPRRKIVLTPEHCKQRRKWCRNHKNDNMNKLIFHDESYYYLDNYGGRYRLFSDDEVQDWKKFGKRVNFQAIISHRFKSELVFFPKKQNSDDFLQNFESGFISKINHYYPGKRIYRCSAIFDQDSSHKSKKTQAQMSQWKFDCVFLPARSPDLNPIEHVWALLKNMVNDREPKMVEEVKSALNECWAQIGLEQIQKYINSFRSRCMECIKNKGKATSYM